METRPRTSGLSQTLVFLPLHFTPTVRSHSLTSPLHRGVTFASYNVLNLEGYILCRSPSSHVLISRGSTPPRPVSRSPATDVVRVLPPVLGRSRRLGSRLQTEGWTCPSYSRLAPYPPPQLQIPHYSPRDLSATPLPVSPYFHTRANCWHYRSGASIRQRPWHSRRFLDR